MNLCIPPAAHTRCNSGHPPIRILRYAPSIEFDALIWNAFTFRTDYSYNSLSDEDGVLNSFEFWNASLSYRKNQDAKLEYQVRATNLLDTKSQAQSNANAFSVSASEYFIQPRFVTFRLIYSL